MGEWHGHIVEDHMLWEVCFDHIWKIQSATVALLKKTNKKNYTKSNCIRGGNVLIAKPFSTLMMIVNIYLFHTLSGTGLKGLLYTIAHLSLTVYELDTCYCSHFTDEETEM